MTTASENTPLQATASAAAGPDAGSTEDLPPSSAALAIGSDVPAASDTTGLLADHKGKLAIGVAATLGLMVYYGWREKRLAKTDPEEYARLQRIKAVVRETHRTRDLKPVKTSGAAGPIALTPQAAGAAPGRPADTIAAPSAPGSAASGSDAGAI